MAQTYYEVLGVAENATDQAIEAAFKSKAREIHPDRVGSGSPYLQKVQLKLSRNCLKEVGLARSR
jgi:curved DNA-binding protein CbpA